MDYSTKNTFVLRDLDGDATYITGKGKTASTVTETIYPVSGGEDWWDIHAGAADDTIDARGSTLNAWLYGDTGNDTIYGSTGYFNHIEGGDGNDMIDARLVGSLNLYPSGRAELLGGSGADTVYGSWGEDLIDGGAGRDIINAGDGSDWVVYDATDIRVEADGGFDTLDASSAAATNVRSGKGVTIDLSSNRDIFSNFEAVVGSSFNDTLTGDNADNRFDGGAGSDTIIAGGGEDFVVYDANDKLVDGGFDRDKLSAENSSFGVVIDLTANTYINFENVEGSRFDDIITGDGNRNVIFGNDGDDVIDGGAGYDQIDLGYGNDTWIYDAADSVYEPYGYSGGVHLGGIDTIDASTASGPVVISMSSGGYHNFENIVGSAFDDVLTGNAWDNIIEGGAGADVIVGGGTSLVGDTASYAGSDSGVTVDLSTGTGTGGDAEGDQLWNISILIGSQFNDVLTGSENTNYLEGGAGADQLNGVPDPSGGSTDFASYAGSSEGVTASLADPSINTGDAEGDSYSDITGLVGSSFDDVLIGDDQNNEFIDGWLFYTTYSGGALVFGGGDDFIDGGAGADGIMTGAGNDTVVYDAADLVHDEGDRNQFGYVNTFDTVDASSSAAGVNIDLNTNYYGFDRIIGSAFDDTLTGNGDDNVFVGGAGADSLYGGWSGGLDTASYADSAAAVTVDLGAGTGSGGDAAGDTFAYIDNLIGSAYADTLTGDAGDNVLEGGAGADQLNGGDGVDTASYAGSDAGVTIYLGSVIGGLGGDAAGDTFSGIENLIGSNFLDTLSGNDSNNRIEGAGGADDMVGGAGQDTYVYESLSDSVELQMDSISDFAWGSGGDVIDFSAIREMDYYADLAYYTTNFADFAAIKAEAEEVLSDWWDIFVATDGTDTYVFMSPEYYGPPVLNSYEAGNDMVIKLVGTNDLTTLSADNFHSAAYVYAENLG